MTLMQELASSKQNVETCRSLARERVWVTKPFLPKKLFNNYVFVSKCVEKISRKTFIDRKTFDVTMKRLNKCV
jgi:hypothetical protein